MAFSLTCDGIKRRDFLRIGALGTGIGLSNYLRLAAAGEVAKSPAKAAIFINLTGGPSHMDTFDLKPNAPDENRGEFKPIETNAPGVQICEHLPKLAKCADKFTILRGVSHTLPRPTVVVTRRSPEGFSFESISRVCAAVSLVNTSCAVR